jgi:hypothetical protein
VIAQVSRVTARGSLRPHDVRVPGHLVDLIVVDPDQKQTCETPYDPAISGQILRPWSGFALAEYGVEKVIARRAAMELRTGMTANLGFGISAMVPRILLEEGHPEAVTWAIEQGAVGGMPLTGFAFGCAANADAFVPAPQQFIFFQGAGFDLAFLSFLEVDTEGNVNVSKLGKKPYLTAGCGGFVDITAHAPKIVFSGWFEAGARGRADAAGHDRHAARQVHQDGGQGGTCHLFRRAGAGAGARGALCHRTLRDPADRRRPGGDRDHARHRPCARHRRGQPGAGVGGRKRRGDAAVAAGPGADGVAAMSGVRLHIAGRWPSCGWTTPPG